MNKADLLHRVLAKLIDALIVGTLCAIIPKVVGMAAGATYILISDGFFRGQSVGKKLIGLRVVVRDLEGSAVRPCTFKDSLIRNLVFCAIVVLTYIPLLGYLFLLLGLLAIAVETYFVYADDHGIRVGDIFAGTQVVDDAQEKP